MQFAITIDKSLVRVDCEINPFQDNYFVEIHRRAFDLARSCVNVAAFATGFGLNLIFELLVLPNGFVSPIRFVIPADLVTECTALKMPAVTLEEKKTMERVLSLVMGEPALFMLLNDLIQCASTPHVTPTNCGRVWDGLRKLVAPGDPKKMWPLFREAMHVDENYATFVSEHSKDPRHGEHVRIDGPTTTEILKRTWILMNRFLEYRKRANMLPLAEFPLLMG
jgi:hypothetical protein